MSVAGTIFEGYRLQRSLGAGWLGRVFAAQNLDDAQTDALRIIDPELCSQPLVMAQFRRLFEKWKRLEHPHILRPFTLVEHEQHVLYTMPLAQSGSARQLLQGRAREGQFIDLIVAIDIVRQAADAIAYAHNNNLIHGNIKPENVLLTPAKAILGRQAFGVLVSDFGVAELQAFSHGVHDRQIVSAPAYMAPEQFRGVRTDTRSDVYSLGVLLYELLTNLVPFEAKDFSEAADKHLHVAPIPPGQIRVEIPSTLEEVVLTCMAKSPEFRYRSMAELEEALQRALNELLPQGPRPTVVLPDIPEPPAPRIEPLRDRTPFPRIQVCDSAGRLVRVEPIRDEQATLGRAPSNTFVLEHAGVSRHHLSLAVRQDQVFVTDLGSTNGTTLSGVPLTPREESLWPDGAVLRVEPFWLRLQPPQRIVQQSRIGVLVTDNDIELKPGQPRPLTVQLANTGQTVDHFRLEVDGVPGEWVQNLYTEVQLNPSTTAETTLMLMVPADWKYTAQTYNVRVLARSRENPEETGFTPMTWKLLPFYHTETQFKPLKRSAWRRTHYQLTLRNLSNVPITYHPTVDDDEGEVKLQSPWEQIQLPSAGGNLHNLLPIRTILYNYYLRLREGIGKVKVSGLPQEVVLAPGEEFKQRLDVSLPTRWIAAPRQRTLKFHPKSNAEIDTPSSLSLLHLPLIPLWALPIVLLAGVAFVFWMMQPPKVIVTVTPPHPLPGQAFSLNFQAENTVRVEVLPWKKTVYNTRAPLTIPQGVNENTQVQVIAHGRLKATQENLTIELKRNPPEIKTFRVFPQNISVGQRATIEWDLAGVNEVQIEPLGTRKSKGKEQITINEDTIVKLAARGDGGQIEREQRIKVLPPVIELFDVQPDTADIGDKVKIRWKVRNGEDVVLEPVGSVQSAGIKEWEVKGAQTFTLKVNSGSGAPIVVAKNLNIYQPTVDEFTVQPLNAKIGETVTVHWKTSHAKEVSIRPLGSVGPSGDQTFTINSPSTDFVITAGNGLTTVNRQATVTASAAAPVITSLKVSPQSAKAGDQINVSWQTTNAISAELVGLPEGSLPLQASGSTVISAPEKTTPLTFTARSADGTLASRTVIINVTSPPKDKPQAPPNAGGNSGGSTTPPVVAPAAPPVTIGRFAARNTSLSSGESTQLSWQVSGTTTVKIFPDGTSLPASGSISVTPKETTTYTLVAGIQKKAVTVTVQPKAAVTPKTPTVVTPPTPPAARPQPVIKTFTAAKTSLGAGQTTRLTWEASGVQKVTITPPGTSFRARGSLTVAPQKTTTYTIQAGTLKQQLTVQVSAPPPPRPSGFDQQGRPTTPSAQTQAPSSSPTTVPPKAPTKANILTFEADGVGVLAGQRITLRWKVTGAKLVTLYPLNRKLPAEGSLAVKPTSTTTYTLLAGDAAQSLTVKVFGKVGGEAPFKNSGGTSSASTNTSAGTAKSPSTTPPPSTKGQSAQANTQTPPSNEAPKVVVAPIKGAPALVPEIVSFEASATEVTAGTKVTISWDVKNARSVYIAPLIGTSKATDSTTIPIYRSTTLRLEARRDGQLVVRNLVIKVTDGNN